MPEQPPTLRDMIIRAVASGTTFESLGERAIDPDTGKVASRAYLNDVANGKVKRIPEAEKLRAIAAALDVPYEFVRRAAIAQWLPGTAPEIAAAPVDLREWSMWSDEDRELVLLAVRAANARVRRQRQAEHHEPGNAA